MEQNGQSAPLKPAESSAPLPDSSDAQWKAKLKRVASGRDALSSRLSLVHEKLRATVKAERPELLARIEKEAPHPAATGYGELPQLQADEPDMTDDSPLEQVYSISELGQWVAKEHGLVTELEWCLDYRLSPLERSVELYGKRAENFRNLDAHVSYHSFWQGEVPKWPAFWDRKRRLLELYRTWRAPVQRDAKDPGANEAREKLEKELFKINPQPTLRIEREESGYLSLPVQIATDITDEAFLAAFAEGIERFWNGSRAMKDAHLRIDLTWDRRSPASLYPGGAPRKGEHIDLARHRERFGAAPLVLTTGADSTHVLHGAIFLGGGKVSRRTLAHEFAHLLGFEDAYVRAYEPAADDCDGVVFREVTPFPGSLLASAGRGVVTRGMVGILMGAYGNGPGMEGPALTAK